MDGLPPSNQNQYSQQPIPQTQTQSKLTDKPFFLIIMLLLIFIVSGVLGFFLSKRLESIKPARGYPVSRDTNLLLPKELLQNPILSLWSAQVQGKVVAKTENSFTLAPVKFENDPKTGSTSSTDISNSQNMIIIYNKDRTELREIQAVQGTDENVSIKHKTIRLSDLELGKIVMGSVDFDKKGESFEVVGKRLDIQPDL